MLPTLLPALVHSLLPWIQQTRIRGHNVLTPGFNDSTWHPLGSRPILSMINATAVILPLKSLHCSLKIADSKVTGHCAPLSSAGISWCAMDLDVRDQAMHKSWLPGLIKKGFGTSMTIVAVRCLPEVVTRKSEMVLWISLCDHLAIGVTSQTHHGISQP